MSYQVLARKWRPRSFATLVGQEHVIKALIHALEQQRLHHAYLFTGTRGVGKTTIARILAKCLNCDTGITPTPCGQCASCQEIDNGRFVDLIEVDAATNTRVEEMRQLLDNASYAPTRGRFKVYVIDEVHMLSNSAFNSMLKTLEEPPEHIKFILATTDPQKIPVTVLSRCLQFNLKQMPPQAIVDHLARVLQAETVAFEPAALRPLAKAAAGSMRDALSLLDQAIAHGAGQIGEAGVRDMLGTVGEDHLYAILDGLAAGDVHAMLACAEAMEARSLDFESALQDLATLLHRIALMRLAPRALTDEDEKARLAPYATAFDDEFLQLCWQIVLHGREELALAPDEYAGFTMTLLRLHAFRPLEGRPMRVGSTEGSAPDTKAAARPRAAPPPAAPATASEAAAAEPPAVRSSFTTAVPAVPLPLSSASPSPATAEESGRALPSAQPPCPAAAGTAPPLPAAPAASLPDWHALAGQLPLAGLAKQLAQRCELQPGELTGPDGQRFVLRLAPEHAHLADRKTDVDRLKDALRAHFGARTTVDLVIAATEGTTPRERVEAERQARHATAVAAFESDAFVRAAIEHFDADIVESTIHPLCDA